MRKTAALLAAAAIAMLAAAPSNADAPAITRTIAAPAEKAAAPAMTQATYIETIRALLAGQPGDSQSDKDLIAGGKSICTDIDNGADYGTFEQQIDQYDLNAAVYRVIIRSSVLTFCPEDAGVLR